MRTLFLLALLAAAVWGGLRLLDGVRAEADWAARGIDVADGTASAIARLAHEDSRAQAILDDPEAYPADYLEMLARNSETLDFVLGYPAHHDDAPVQSLTESLDTVPLLLQWDMRWGYQPYGSSTIAVSGCAPACLAMAASYLTGDATITPYRVAQYAANAGCYVPGQGTSWSIFSDAAPCVWHHLPSAFAGQGTDRRRARRGTAGDLLDAAGRFHDRRAFYRAV